MLKFPADTRLSGELRTNGRVRFAGVMEGDAYIDGHMLITDEATWRGKITSNTIEVKGIVEGDIFARNRLIVCEGGQVTGNVVAPAVSIAFGGVVKGQLHMGNIKQLPVLLEWQQVSELTKATKQITEKQKAEADAEPA